MVGVVLVWEGGDLVKNKSAHITVIAIHEGSQTRGPRASCGPQDDNFWPAS